MKKKGFTLIELLVVIAIIAILAGIVIIAVNPTRQMGQARNAQRRADVLTVLNAVHQSYIDNSNFPKENEQQQIDLTARQLGTNSTGCTMTCGDWTTDADCLDLSVALVPTYIAGIPFDPQLPGAAGATLYAVKKVDLTSNRITIRACQKEIVTTNIEVTR